MYALSINFPLVSHMLQCWHLALSLLHHYRSHDMFAYLNIVMSTGLSRSIHICIMENMMLGQTNSMHLLLYHLVYLHLMWLRYSLSAMQTFMLHIIYVRYSLSAKIMKA